jgi:hypothetical protein
MQHHAVSDYESLSWKTQENYRRGAVAKERRGFAPELSRRVRPAEALGQGPYQRLNHSVADGLINSPHPGMADFFARESLAL